MRFPQRGIFICEIADSEGNGVEIERIRGDHGERLGICEEEIETGGMGVGGLERAFASFGKHLGIDVGYGYAGGGGFVDVGCVVKEAEGDVSSAARYVEHFPALGGGGRGGGGRGGETGVYRADEVVSGIWISRCYICKKILQIFKGNVKKSHHTSIVYGSPMT